MANFVWPEGATAAIAAGGGGGGPIPPAPTALDTVLTVRRDYSTSSVGSTYVTLVADSGGTIIRQLQIFDGSGETLALSLDASTDKLLITPGGNGVLSMQIPVNSTISIKAISVATVNTGEIDINFMG